MLINYSKSIGEKIRYLRVCRNLTQEELAANIGVSNKMISGYEKGTLVPDRTTLEALAAFFKYDIRYFTEGQCFREEHYLAEGTCMIDIYEGEADKKGNFECVDYILSNKELRLGRKTYIWRVTEEFSEKYGVPVGTNYLVSVVAAPVHGDKLLVVSGGKTLIVRYEYTEEGKFLTECRSDAKRMKLKKSDIICGLVRGTITFEQCP